MDQDVRQASYQPLEAHIHAAATTWHNSVMNIKELVYLVLSHLEEQQDLLNMALVCKTYADASFSILWEEPDFPGDPLTSMAKLFPAPVHIGLKERKDESLLVSREDFKRFDYYAQFVRRLHYWQASSDGFVARRLSASRPDTWLFPNLRSLHVGSDRDSLGHIGPYLSPTLQKVTLNHWDSGAVAMPLIASVVQALSHILHLPRLQALDLLDTVYLHYEQESTLLDSLLRLIPRLDEFYSSNFTLVRSIFQALSNSSRLEGFFLDLTAHQDPTRHNTILELMDALRDGFRHLTKIMMRADVQSTARTLQYIQRQLHHVDLRLEGPVNIERLCDITHALASSSASLESLRCACGEAFVYYSSYPLVMALQPLKPMVRLRDLRIEVGLSPEQMLTDEHIEDLFGRWPHLQCFFFNSEPGRWRAPTSNAVSYEVTSELTLNSLLTIRRLCPNLLELSLPFADLSRISPVLDRQPSKAYGDIRISFTRSHVPEVAHVTAFVKGLWPNAEVRFA